MIGQVIKLPFWFVSRVLGSAFSLVRVVFAMGFGVIRFLVSHLVGTVFGALIGFFMGRKHIGLKVFKSHKKK